MSAALRSTALIVAAALAGGLAMGIAYTPHDGRLTALFLAATGAPVLFLVHVACRHRHRLGGLARQFTVAIAVSVGLTLVAVGVIALLMFVSPHDAFTMALLLGFAGVLAAYSAWLLSVGVMEDVHALTSGLDAVGAGTREATIATQARDELGDLAAAANRMIEQLAERERERDGADKARQGLLAAVSHDLRTPLASLRVLSEAIEDDMVDGEIRREYVAQMSVHIRSLGALIDDLFELSRLEAGDIEWTLQQVPLDQLVEETVDAMRAQAEARRVDVRADVPAGLAAARANPEKLQRVLFNLIQNAIRHTPTDGSVTVRAHPASTALEIEVTNTGQAIAADERDHVFEPFYRGGDESARTRSGAGLGLTICRAIVEAHGGRIWLADADEGTRVCFTVPMADGAQAAPAPSVDGRSRRDRMSSLR
jgi:signal transduction histidine kinase